MDLTVTFAGVRLTLEVKDADAGWMLVRNAAEAAAATPGPSRQPSPPSPSLYGGGSCRAAGKPVSKAEQVRAIAREVLADGKVHERREIAKAVRERGLRTQLINAALKGHFEKGENALGRPTYRDRTVPSGYLPAERTPDGEKPEWMRDRPPSDWRQPTALGTWGNGGNGDG